MYLFTRRKINSLAKRDTLLKVLASIAHYKSFKYNKRKKKKNYSSTYFEPSDTGHMWQILFITKRD